MKQISIQDLKISLSAAIADAASGSTIVITKHNTPVAKLGPVHSQNLHIGKVVGKGGLRAAIKSAGKIPYLDALLEDRGNR
jgi:prevent-host-death family protein